MIYVVLALIAILGLPFWPMFVIPWMLDRYTRNHPEAKS